LVDRPGRRPSQSGIELDQTRVCEKHPGFTLVYVVQGTIVAKVSGGEERTLTAGQMFFEQPGSVHEVSRNASQTQPARLLALIFAKKGLPKTTPVQ